MFRFIAPCLPALLATGLATLSAHAQTPDNIQIDRADVPKRVWQTVRTIAPDAVFTEIGIEREGYLNIFEFGLIDPDGLHLEIDVTADGILQEIEWETPFDEVQSPVRVAFRIAHPGATIRYVERSIRRNGDTVYEIEAISAEGQPIDFEVLDNGRQLQVLGQS